MKGVNRLLTVALLLLPVLAHAGRKTSLAVTFTGTANSYTSFWFSGQFSTSGGATPYGYALVSGTMPPGLSLTVNGSISGIPTATGAWTFGVQVKDNSRPRLQAVATLTITVAAPPPVSYSIGVPCTDAVRIAIVLPSAHVGQQYTVTLQPSTGVPPFHFVWVGGALPDGLAWNATQGIIAGTPTTGTLSPAQFTIECWDANATQ